MFEYQSKSLLEMTFGETQDANWKLLAEEIGGEFISDVRDDWGSSSSVVCRVESWTIILEAYKYRTPKHPGVYAMHTRMTANYLTTDNFGFWVTPPSYMDELKSFFGAENNRDIKIGEAELNRKYVFYGSDVEKTRRLFENTNLRRMLVWLDNVSYGISGYDGKLSKTYGSKSVQLSYHHPHLIYDIRRLRVLFELFGETLIQLKRIGSANS